MTDDETVYALVIDDSVQWFAYIIELNKIDGEYQLSHTGSYISVPFAIFPSPIVKNIRTTPPINFGITIDQINGFYGWYITEDDYSKLKYICEEWKTVTSVFEWLGKKLEI